MESKTYNRLIEGYILSLMQELPAIAIEGLKGVGKTVSAKRISNTVFELDQVRDKELIENNYDVLSASQHPVLIDEWQKVPAVWGLIRGHQTPVDSKAVAIEVKMSQTIDESDVKNLLWLKSNLGEDLTDAVLVTTGPAAYRLPNGIAVIPASLLGA